MKSTLRIVTITLGVAAVGGAALALRPRPVVVDVATVVRAPLEQVIVDGRARVRERYTVSTPVAGSLARIDLREGDIVEPGAVLARLAPGTGKSEPFEITSPVHGRVLHVLHKREGVVAAGTALLEVGDPRALELVADVLSQDAVAMRPGMLARILHGGGGQNLTAKVRRVEPSPFTKVSALGVDELRVHVLLDPDGAEDPWALLGDGSAVEIEITVSKPDVVQIPTSALFREGAGWAVFAVQEGRARDRVVEPGHRGPLQTEILRGLEPGDVVIIHPGAEIDEGARVTSR